MKKSLILFILAGFLITFVSCKRGDRKLNVIEEEKFVNVLTDIHMADATLVVKGYRVNADSIRVRKYYNDVLIEYNVTQKQIHNTFVYYARNPEEFEKVYEKVSANIGRIEKEHHENTKNRKAKKTEEFGKVKDKDKKS